MLSTSKQLAQRLPTTTSDTLLYQTPDSSTVAFIKTIIVCNTTGSSATYTIWVNQGGVTTGDQFALIKTMTISANASDQRIYPEGIILRGSNASMIVKVSVASALNFTLYGEEVKEV